MSSSIRRGNQQTAGTLAAFGASLAILITACAQRQSEPTTPEPGWSEEAPPPEFGGPPPPSADPPALEEAPGPPDQDPSEQDELPNETVPATVPPHAPAAPEQPSDPNAQSPSGPSSNEGTPIPQPGTRREYSDDQVAAFARAYLDAARIQQQYQEAFQNARTSSRAQSIQQRAAQEIASVIEDQEGISVQEFQQLQLALESDPQLLQRVESSIQDLAR